MTYKVLFSSRAKKDINKIPRDIAKKIIEDLEYIAAGTNPFVYLKRLAGHHSPPFYSLREGDYRVIMTVTNTALIIHVVSVGHRRSVYRKF